MPKAKVTLSIDAYTWEQFKSTYDNASEEVQEVMKEMIDVSEIEDEEMLEKKIEELEEERDEVEKEMEGLEDKLQGIESELSTARATLEKLEREKEEEQDQLATFKAKLQKNSQKRESKTGKGMISAKWKKPSDIPDYWVKELDKSKQELWEMREDC